MSVSCPKFDEQQTACQTVLRKKEVFAFKSQGISSGERDAVLYLSEVGKDTHSHTNKIRNKSVNVLSTSVLIEDTAL